MTPADAAGVRAVAFDLDGTLVDSRLDLAQAVNRMRGELDLPPLAVTEVLGMVGEGARNLVRRALGGEPDPALLERAFESFLAHYDRVCLDRTRPFPGVDDLLRRLAGRLPLAVVTNKPERFSRRIVDHFGWGALFAFVIGGDSLPTRKPDPGVLRSTAERLGVAPGELLLVGDSRTDAEAALAAGTRLVLVEWGFARPAERADLADRPWIGSPAELEAVLAPLGARLSSG